MAETSAVCLTSCASSVASISRCREISPSPSSLSTFSPAQIHRSFFHRPYHSSRRLFRLVAPKSSSSGGSGGGLFGNDEDLYGYGSYPWDRDSHGDAHAGIQWVPEDRITLFTADGLIQFGGSLIPQRISPSEKLQGKSKSSQRYQRFQESDYMDPKQSLCLGSLFDIAATNGLDMGRRLCIIGFCRSIEMLSDVVEDTVLEHGGEVVAAEKASTGGLHEKLSMTVAVPLLWGVPPASETLHLAVRSGGGIVDKVFWQWHFL